MQVLSTMRSLVVHNEPLPDSHDVFDGSSPTIGLPTFTGNGTDFRPFYTAQLVVKEVAEPTFCTLKWIGSTEHMVSDYCEGPLQDGELLWYCGECRDGPFGVWNPVCTCGHPRDGCCTVVEK